MIRYEGQEYLGGEGMYALYEPCYTCECDICGDETSELYRNNSRDYCRDCLHKELEAIKCDCCKSPSDYFYLIKDNKRACSKCAEDYFGIPADEISDDKIIGCCECGDCEVIGEYEGRPYCKDCFSKLFPEADSENSDEYYDY